MTTLQINLEKSTAVYVPITFEEIVIAVINNDIVFIHVCEDSAQRPRNKQVQLHLYFSGSNKLAARSMYFLASAVELKKTCIRTNQSLQSQSSLSYEEDYNAADIGGVCQNTQILVQQHITKELKHSDIV